ncbi:MAG: nucleoside-diphosphate kinase, partial [Nitrospiria bacterium]
DKGFYESLVSFISSGPVIAMVLEGEGAILKTRSLMGATDPQLAEKGSLRADFGGSIEENVVHGSDSEASAAFEIPFFFSRLDINW